MIFRVRQWCFRKYSKSIGVDRCYSIQGGLGNQMYQYAFALAHNASFSARSVIDTRFYDKYDDHNGWEIEKIFELEDKLPKCDSKLIGTFVKLAKKAKLLCEENNDIGYRPQDFRGGAGCWSGYRSSFKYFEAHTSLVRKNFSFKERHSLDDHPTYLSILMKNSVSLHIRRGDYLATKNSQHFLNICTKEYYDTAIEYMKENVSNPHFYVFSDDTEWCREQFISDEFTIVDENTGEESWKDMYLMSCCKHNIIANSTFSWWGMWLGLTSKKVVIGPNKFLNDGLYNSLITDILPEFVQQVDASGDLVNYNGSSQD